jgi:hypothetical protein
MCEHRLNYHSGHGKWMTVYCVACGAQWTATMFIAPHPDGTAPPYLDRPEPEPELPAESKT